MKCAGEKGQCRNSTDVGESKPCSVGQMCLKKSFEKTGLVRTCIKIEDPADACIPNSQIEFNKTKAWQYYFLPSPFEKGHFTHKRG